MMLCCDRKRVSNASDSRSMRLAAANVSSIYYLGDCENVPGWTKTGLLACASSHSASNRVDASSFPFGTRRPSSIVSFSARHLLDSYSSPMPFRSYCLPTICCHHRFSMTSRSIVRF